MKDLVIGLGSNLGDRKANIGRAIGLIGQKVGRVTALSAMIETEPWGFESDHKFLNCVAIISGKDILPAPGPNRIREIIGILQSIESDSGRVRTGVFTDRAIDLDILFYGDEIIHEPGITIPHPRLHERDFILVSLMELFPDRVHPLLGKTIRELSGSGPAF
jgi:2-amino-4-hydroxy-6-hydroxymethyldihydropteridine diphosphokinase